MMDGYKLLALFMCLAVPQAITAGKTQRERKHTRWYELSNYTFQQYIVEYGKNYSGHDEIKQREKNFARNLEYIKEHNKQPNISFYMGVNLFTDWSKEEFKRRRLSGKKRNYGLQPSQVSLGPLYQGKSLPDSVDWRNFNNVLTDIKDQGDCGSCWAFSVAESIESRAAIASNRSSLVALSAQQVTSCTPNPDHCGGTGNCDGATEALGYDYVAGVGLSSEKEYPYRSKNGKDRKCKSNEIVPAATVKGHVALPANEYRPLIEAVLEGPLSVAVAVSDDFEFYESGIFRCDRNSKRKKKARQCWEINHAVQLVGYGTREKKGKMEKYWIVRNSWGEGWGEAGYIRLARYGEGKEPCGEDTKTKDGSACGPPYPKKERVCGESGILSESTLPLDPSFVI
eukprot:g9789.t1